LARTEWSRQREEGASHRASSVHATGKEPTAETALIFARILVILTCCNCVAAIAAGGILVVTKPHTCAATWDEKTLQLASTCALSLSGCQSGATAAARRVVVVRRQFDAAARTVASSSARACTLCECVSVRAAETNTVQETVQRLSEEAVNY
jgi:hypothetical protein